MAETRDVVIERLQRKIDSLMDSTAALEAKAEQAVNQNELNDIDRLQEQNADAIAECDGWIAQLRAGEPFVQPTSAQTQELLNAMKALGAATALSASLNSLLTAAGRLVRAYEINVGGAGAALVGAGRAGAMRLRAAALVRTLDARPDRIDFRDQMFVPTLVEVPEVSDLEGYFALDLPILDQGQEGACTGFGLAAMANFLNRQRRIRPLRFNGALPAQLPDVDRCSARMLYILARRYDEWEGEVYDGSSARGAMKGWHKHGVCHWDLWADAAEPDCDLLTEQRAGDALDRPLGAYFRVNHKDLVAMHAAIAEVGVVYATCRVHEGWNRIDGETGVIPFEGQLLGGHAFAIVGYDRQGFWLQNSWGTGWGKGGLAHLSYADWLANGTDVWVARLGAPVDLAGDAAARMRAGAPSSYASYVYADLRPHVITLGNDGALRSTGTYGLTETGLERILQEDLVRRVAPWPTKRVLVYAHGGLVAEDYAIQYAANQRQACLDAEVYPLNFIWRSNAWATLGNILTEAIPGLKDASLVGSALDFMLDRLDDTLEPVARDLGGKVLWDEMKENAIRATASVRGAARKTARILRDLKAAGSIDEIHLSGHSAGAVFHAALASYLGTQGKIKNGPMVGEDGLGVEIASVSLWAPACTLGIYNQTFQPLLQTRRIGKFAVYTLQDAVEQDDNCAHLYNKSLLYLVSHALERRRREPPVPGEALLGLEKDILAAPSVAAMLRRSGNAWLRAPDGRTSNARQHGGFDTDPLTLASTLARITGDQAAAEAQAFSTEGARRLRRAVTIARGFD